MDRVGKDTDHHFGGRPLGEPWVCNRASLLCDVGILHEPDAGATGIARECGILRKTVTVLPKRLDEEVARLHLEKFGAELTELSKDRADYINVEVEGPFKTDAYRY